MKSTQSVDNRLTSFSLLNLNNSPRIKELEKSCYIDNITETINCVSVLLHNVENREDVKSSQNHLQNILQRFNLDSANLTDILEDPDKVVR